MELTTGSDLTVGSLMRLVFRDRFLRKSLPLLPLGVMLLIIFSVWQTLNDISEKVTLLTNNSAHEQSNYTFKPKEDFSLLLSSIKNNESSSSRPIHRTRLLSTAFCQPDPVFLLILVSTNVGNFDRRQSIRKTWGADFSINTRWKTVFLLGRNNNDTEMEDLSKEAQIYGDIVQADYQEHFWNMSYKVAMGFEWSVKYCTFHYLLKADDDVFVNTLGLTDFLSKYTTPRRKLYTGNIMIGSVVLRDGRYAVSPEEYNETEYKPYCSGGGYVLSRDVVEKFLSFFDVLKPLKIDDAYIGILADRAGVEVTHNEDFRMYENNCTYRETTLVQHPARGDCAIKLYHKMIGWIKQEE